ncbi:MAG: hypothetical protein FWD48_08430 [Oscillospiraceae bacterium]|nr:hypothetical protein [Oscillospiraceae bacterium]
MKKLMALLLAVIFLFTACGSENISEAPETHEGEALLEIEAEEPLDIETAPETEPAPAPEPEPEPKELVIDEREFFLYERSENPAWQEELAEDIKRAFVEKDVEYLSEIFGDYSKQGFDFVSELDFAEFDIVYVHTDDGRHTMYVDRRIWTFVFYITVEDGEDDIFTRGGREWELQIKDNHSWSPIQQFTPIGTKIFGYWNLTEHNEYAQMCALFSSNFDVFETINDFNLIRERRNWSDNSFHTRLHFALKRIEELQGNEDSWEGWQMPTDYVIDRAAYTFGITNINREALDEYEVPARGWFWHYPVFVSEKTTDTGVEIILDYYGDYGYLLLAKTMKYTLELGDEGVKFISVECLFSDDILILPTDSV